MRKQQVARKKTAPWLLLGLLLATLLAAAGGSPALAQEGAEDAQYEQSPTEVRATGVLERAAPHGQDTTPIYAITDEATGTPTS